MASPYNSTDQMNSRSTSNSSAGTQISKTAQVGAVSDANETSEHFDVNQAGDWDSATQGTEQKTTDSKSSTRSAQPTKSTRQASNQSTRTPSTRTSNSQAEAKQTSSETRTMESGSGVDVLKGSLSNAFDQIVKEIEPQINEFASNFANQAVAKGGDLGRVALQRVQRQSWGRIALAGALFAGAVAVLGYQAAEIAKDSADDLH